MYTEYHAEAKGCGADWECTFTPLILCLTHRNFMGNLSQRMQHDIDHILKTAFIG